MVNRPTAGMSVYFVPARGRPRAPRPRTHHLRCPVRRAAPLDEQGDRGHQQRDADDVVQRAARVVEDELRRGEQHRGTDHRERRDTERAADAPRGQQRERQPEQVHERREHVAAHEHDAERVQELRGRRIEHGQRVAVGVVQPRRPAGLEETRRDRHVVPEGVGGAHHAPLQRVGDTCRPLREDHRDGDDCTRVLPPGERGGDLRAVRSGCHRRSVRSGRGRRPGEPPHRRIPRPRTRRRPGAIRNRPTVPSSSEMHTTNERPMTISASAAGGPESVGRNLRRSATCPNAIGVNATAMQTMPIR